MIKGKTPEEIRKTFNIKNDFTEEEEAQVGGSQLILDQMLFYERLKPKLGKRSTNSKES